MDVLLDINIIVDLLLKRDGYRDAKRVYAIASLFSSKMWMAASSVDNLYYVLHSEVKRIKHLANEKCADEDSKEVMVKCGSCGASQMRQNGTCMLCEICGETSGCS